MRESVVMRVSVSVSVIVGMKVSGCMNKFGYESKCECEGNFGYESKWVYK